jgi:hypothetical protein
MARDAIVFAGVRLVPDNVVRPIGTGTIFGLKLFN